MATINWNDNLSVKIDSIDQQHKKLIELVNTFYDNINLGTSKEKMMKLIKGLKEYTVFHFSTEERYMKQFNYPAYLGHKAEHDKFIETVINYEERYKSGKLLVTIEVTNFIKDWITSHIMGTDQKYSDFLIRNGVR
ncbi:MAG TPA: bacteriohemerythrin [Bacteroidales bacterium]